MVVALKPGKFYGSSLPRPRFYTDVKFNSERVDPPPPVNDPLMSWAQEAHWTMGGLSFTRHRLQGRIEGNVKKLSAERERFQKKRNSKSPEKSLNKNQENGVSSPSPPPAPVAVKRQRRVLVDEEVEEEEEMEMEAVEHKRKTARKLKDDFDKVATRQSPRKAASGGDAEEVLATAMKTRGRKREEEDAVKRKGRKLVKGNKIGGQVEPETAVSNSRTSPRLAKNRSK